MKKKFNGLQSKMSPESKERLVAQTIQLFNEIPLNKLRHATALSEKLIANVLNLKQPAFTMLQKRTDIYLFILRSLIKAMGGDLIVIARFPEGDVRITNFTELVVDSHT